MQRHMQVGRGAESRAAGEAARNPESSNRHCFHTFLPRLPYASEYVVAMHRAPATMFPRVTGSRLSRRKADQVTPGTPAE